jgi:pyruvate dehydrogenase E2 component (dihydrolipoamide acetyltransferase)
LVVVKLPDIGEGIAEGEIIRFLVKVGDLVEKYQPLAEVMTVKVNVEIPSPVSGRVVKLLAEPGQVLKVGEPFIEIETQEAVEEKPAEAVQVAATPSKPESMPHAGEVLATPAVRKLAKELGVNLSKVVGTGPGGRILEEDVRRAAASAETRIPMKGLRRMIAERLVQAKSRAALVTVFEEVDAGQIVEVRNELRQQRQDLKITYMPLIMKAIVAAVGEVPAVNGWVDDDREEIVLSKEVNIGFAVDTPSGLLVPILKNVEKKDVWTLAREVEELAEKARQGKLGLEDVRGGTISISNYGALNSLSGTPIVNYPEIAIVGVGRVEKKPVVRDGQIVVGNVMQIAVTFDHRAVDGGTMAAFVNALKKHLENIRQTLAGA